MSGFDLTTTYLDLDLRCPIVASAGPLGRDLDAVAALEEAGVGAIVLPSLFEEQVRADAVLLQQLMAQGSGSFVEAATYIPEVDEYRTGPTPYLRHLTAVRDQVSIPVIASLNGTSPGGWIEYASMMADAGASAIELNPYLVAADPMVDAATVDARLVDLVAKVCAAVEVPVAVKLSPWMSALANLATRLEDAGAAGLVLFNRFVQPDIDLDTLTVVDAVHLSTPSALLLPLRWCALLRDRLACSLALSGGVHDGDAAAKAVLCGADVVMSTSALLRHGPAFASSIRDGMVARLEAHDYVSLRQARGALSAGNAPRAEDYERAHYVHALQGFGNR
jgi:dihydroorotate dehydrogenase (fumarate)